MEDYLVSHIFQGLMCFTNRQSAKIYNTSTRQLVVLPDIEESNIIAEDMTFKNFMYRIGHDAVHNQYKVVCIVSASKNGRILKSLLEHWVFILGGVSNRWRKISSPCPPHDSPLKQRSTINGRMYYLACESLNYLLVSFDISSEETRLLQKPEDFFWHRYYINLIEYAGKIAIFVHADLVKDGVMELWVMEDEEKNIWSRKKLVLHPSQMDMVKNNADSPYLKFRGTTRNGDVILVPNNKILRVIHGPIHVLPQGTTLFYVLLYNIQKNHLRRVEIEDGSNCFLNKRWDIIGLDDTENLMCL
ncbi:F-box/kelch-repeat protein [Raphanus sativus]|nr:F-box/kelch-repeat protein [Raphanus sativus]